MSAGSSTLPVGSPLQHVDYLVGGLRISLVDSARTVGPRSHITEFVEALRNSGSAIELFVASDQPALASLAERPEGVGAETPGRLRLLLADGVRVVAALWAMVRVRRWSRHSAAGVVYERVAVMSCLGLAHRRRRQAMWVTESNGLFARETAADRAALGSPRIARAIERMAYRRSDAVVVVSRALRDEVCDFASVDPAKVIVVPNAVSDAALTISRRTAGGVPIVGFAGSVVAHQRVDLLIAASVRDDLRGRVKVEIIGDGTALGALAQLCGQLGIEDEVVFLGRRGQEETLQTMSRWTAGYAGHVATSSTRMYHSPLKLYEYAGLGLDVIATRSDDATELGTCGVRLVYVDEPSEGAVADALRTVLAASARTDDDTRAVRRRVAEAHSWATRVAVLDERLRGLASAPSAARPPKVRR